ncbi:MAG: hypothetical protein LBJ16_04050 [Holosporaceae bacterium]|nr:hypothetical protein [Holosporaceae bacterium]
MFCSHVVSLMVLCAGFAFTADAASHAGKRAATKKNRSALSHSSDGSSSQCVDGFLNINLAHERQGQHALGGNNVTGCGINPVFSYGPFTVEGDIYCGRQFVYTSFLNGEKHLSQLVPADDVSLEFHNNYGPHIKGYAENASAGRSDKASVYLLSYRATYVNDRDNYKVVAGSTSSRNTIGFQRGLTGLGVSLFRQGGNGSVVNNGSGIVITRLCRAECKLGDRELVTKILPPGVYSLDDFPEEAKLPGVSLSLIDQLDRSEKLTVDYFGGYATLAPGDDDFDIVAVCESSYELSNPHRQRFHKRPRFVANYRRGHEAFTYGFGVEAWEKSFSLDSVVIVPTKFGTLAPNISYSYATRIGGGERHAGGFGIYYKAPVADDSVVFFETFFGLKGRGFSDAGKSYNDADSYNKFIENYFTDAGLKARFLRNVSESASGRQLIARVYTKQLFNCITPAFLFGGKWSKNQRFREYTLSLICDAFGWGSLVVSAGLSYDDPYKGSNAKAPDRRLTISCSIPIGSELSVCGAYHNREGDPLRNNGSVNWKPSEVPGLELEFEEIFQPGYSNPNGKVKYVGPNFSAKLEEHIDNRFENKGSAASHRNSQRFFFGSSITTRGLKRCRPSNINVLRPASENLKGN